MKAFMKRVDTFIANLLVVLPAITTVLSMRTPLRHYRLCPTSIPFVSPDVPLQERKRESGKEKRTGEGRKVLLLQFD